MSIANITNELMGSSADSMKDIRLTYKKGSRIARIKVGPKLVDRGLEHLDPKDVKAWVIKQRDELQAQYQAEHPEENSPTSGSNQTPASKSFKGRILFEAAKWIERQDLRKTRPYDSALNYLWEGLGTKANLDPKLLKPVFFERVRKLLYESGLADATIKLYAKQIRELLAKVVKYGLNVECVEELKNIRKQKISEASGEPIRKTHLKIILDLVGAQIETIRLLIWIGLSGGPQIVDAVFMPLTSVDWVTGMISYWRVKTGEKIEFAALPPLLDLLRQRRERLGPGAIYVFPELIFMDNEVKRPDCNTVAWEKVPQDVAVRGAANGMKAVNEFLNLCGIKTKDITYKSFRKAQISFWASIGIKLKTRMRMAGHSREDAHNRYDTPAELEILRARDITWKYVEAVRDNRPFFIPTGPYDIYEALMNHWEKFPEMMRDSIHNELGGSLARVEQLLAAGFADQQRYLESKFKQQEGMILELTLSVQSLAIQVQRLTPRRA